MPPFRLFLFQRKFSRFFFLKGNFLDFLSQRKFSVFSLSKEIFWIFSKEIFWIFSLKENFPNFSFSKDIFWIFSLKGNFLDFLSQRKLSKFFPLKGNFPNFSLSKEIFKVFLSQRKISGFSLSKEIFRPKFKKSPACFIAGLRQAWRAAKISHTLGLTRLLCVIFVPWLLTVRLQTWKSQSQSREHKWGIQKEAYQPLLSTPQGLCFLCSYHRVSNVFLICALLLSFTYHNYTPYSTLILERCFFFESLWVTFTQYVSMTRDKLGHQLV